MTDQIIVEELDKKIRLDAYLASKLDDISRSRLKNWIESGFVLVNDKVILSPNHKIKSLDNIKINYPEPEPTELIPENIKLDIIFEDNDIVVINKPAGLVVHPGAGNYTGTLVHALIYHCPDLRVGDKERPGIVHRLDKDTSGVMICAKTSLAHERLSQSFKDRDTVKIYKAFCIGGFKEHEFELKTGHRRHSVNRKKYTTKLAVPDSQSESLVRMAHSKFKVLHTKDNLSELEVQILTGRTHQIRAHLADINKPIIGDVLYGGDKALERQKVTPLITQAKKLTRHALHAESLRIKHPTTNEVMTFVADLPEDLLDFSKKMG